MNEHSPIRVNGHSERTRPAQASMRQLPLKQRVACSRNRSCLGKNAIGSFTQALGTRTRVVFHVYRIRPCGLALKLLQ